MKNSVRLLLLTASFSLGVAHADTPEPIVINSTNQAPLFDGHCKNDEWATATKIDLPAGVSVYLMHDNNSLYVCAKGKSGDYTVIDLYVEDAATGHLYNLHASAQLGERTFTNKEWSENDFWNNQDWGGFWVPYAGTEETEEGPRTKFLKGSHREIQVLRKKFKGNTWNMMIGVGAIENKGSDMGNYFYPEDAVDTDPSTWLKYSFSE